MLVGRDAQLGQVLHLVEGLRDGHGGALLLHGEPGIGKTALLERAREAAGDATVLQSAGIESESSLSFGGLRDLIWPVVEHRGALPAPQEAALAGALTLGPPEPGDRLAVCVATLGVLEAAAADGPLLVLVDDLHWLDSASRECVAYAARRTRGPVVLLLAGRDGYRYDDLEGIPDTELGPLDPAEAAELLATAASDLVPEVSDAICAAADGNPLALLELPTTLTPGQRAGTAPLEHPLPPGRELERVYARRLKELPSAARTALLVAAASHTNETAVVDPACRALGSSAAELRAAEERGLVRLGDGRARFSHPLVRGAVYHRASPADRRAAHRALADVVAGEASAWHGAAAALGPDDDVAGALDEVAGIAAGRRAYGTAADALERAARLSTDPEASARRLLGAGATALSAGRVGQATTLAREARELATEPPTRAGAQHLRGMLALWTGQVAEALDLLELGANEAVPINPMMGALVLADAAFAHTAAGNCRRSLAVAQRAFALLGAAAEAAVRAPVLAILAWALVLRGQTREARPLMREAQQLAGSVQPFSPAAQIVLIAVNCRLPDEDYEGALADGLERVAAAREAGALFALPMPLCIAVEASYRLGRWDRLRELCDEAVATAEETDQWGPATQSAITRARLAAATGDEAQCRADAQTGLDLAESAGVGSMVVYGHGALGFLELSAGRVEAAIGELELAERSAEECGLEEPTVIPWAPDLVEAYVRAGREEEARRVLATLSRQADLADTACAAALAERCQGLLAPGGFDEHFGAALEHHDRRPMPFERARTLLAWGMRLHRARRRTEARERLRAAVGTFEQLGAVPWAELAAAELRAAGGRRRQTTEDDALTAQEERVAQAAVRGASTREIATELYLSPKTVEFHLGRAYRKLGVSSRGQLAAALAERALKS